METFAPNDKADYYFGITSITVNGKNAYELKGKFLDDLHNNAFSGTNEKDVVEHIEYYLKIIDPIKLPNVDHDKLRVFHNSIMKDKMVYKGNNVIRALMTVPIFVGTFFVVTDFVVLENMDAYRDEGMGNVIFGVPFLREVGIKTKQYEGIITIYNGDDEVTYQMVRSHSRFKHHTNEQCNKIPPLLKVSEKDEMNEISHAYQKLKGFYKGVLNLGPDYIRDAKTEEWLTRGHISMHEMEWFLNTVYSSLWIRRIDLLYRPWKQRNIDEYWWRIYKSGDLEDTEGVFGIDDHEVYSSTGFDCNVHKSPLQNDEGIKRNNVSQISETGIEVIFYEQIMQKGNEKWGLTICGQFVGYDMHISELRYNIRRMWRKFGIAEIDKWKNGCYMFKFRDEISMNAVLEKGPWMVRNKPLFLQKWSSKIRMTKVEPKKLPVWVKIVNVPLEAYIGNISYARVLVEMDSEKELKNEIEIQHELWNCKNGGNVNIGNKSSKDDEENKEKGVGYGGIRHDKNDEPKNSRKEYGKKKADADAIVKSKEKNKWKVGENVVDEIRKSSNKYYVLDSLPEDNDQELIMLKERMIVDKWERDRIKENTSTVMKDVLEANDGIATVMKSKEVSGIKGEVLHDVFNGI
ncbi:homeodomain-like protein [Tanacetum coccineum]